jgi:hypothetical protein
MLDLPVLESRGILALHFVAVESFNSLVVVLVGRWTIPTQLVVLLRPRQQLFRRPVPASPLLPPPFAFVSQWPPSGTRVTALREAVCFPA